jgi:predicted acylesterase/phospholipase RssA
MVYIKMAIQHLVLSGGGPAGFSIYGALRESAKTGVWNPDDIKSIWSTSAGAMIGAMIYITTNWDTLDNYIIRRPWDKLCSVNLYTLINAYMGCGLFNISVVEKMFSPLLLSNDYNVDITLQELYEKTGVEFHAFTTEINQNVCVDVSHETHPTWRLVDAVYASSALPGMFSPFIKDDNNRAYMDGGFYCNYPLQPCIQKYSDTDTILGIVKHFTTCESNIDQKSTLLDFIGKISAIMFNFTVKNQTQSYVKIPHEIVLGHIEMTIESIKQSLADESTRCEFIEIGVVACRECIL